MIGKTVSHYRILEKLGEGGMGVVYKAEDTKLKRHVALKFLPLELTRDMEAKERFIQEAQAASTLEHQNICNIHEIDETKEGQLFICMACYSGETLKDKVAREPLELEEATDVMVQIAKGLIKAHERGIIHRDIKPANIFITEDQQVKIVDFGIAKLMGQMKLTKTGTTIGTVAYMSPEQSRGEQVDHRTDIWSFGVMFYEILTGKLPFRADYDQAMIFAILNLEPEPISTFRQDIPRELEQLISKALAKNQKERYQKVEEMLFDLQEIKGQLVSASYTGRTWLKESTSSIAVLPFANLSSDTEQEYFCDGLAEEIINALGRLENLRVVARTSAFSFKGKAIDIREIGMKLNVATLLEGSVRKVGNRLRISVQLVNVADGYHLWSEKYDRKMKDIFAIQEEISLAIVDNLKLKVLGDDRAKLLRRQTENPDAHNLYLLGRYFWNKRTKTDIQRSIVHFQKAVEIDPTFALAYSGMAEAYVTMGIYKCLPPEEVSTKAKKAVATALKLDSTLSQAHSSLAMIKIWIDWDCTGADHEFRLALNLNPADAEAHHQYSHLLAQLGRFEEAILQMKYALELEPLSLNINACLGQVLFLARRYDESIEQLQKTIEMDPDYYDSHGWLAMAHLLRGNYEQAIAKFKEAAAFEVIQARMTAGLAYTYAVTGKESMARAILGQMLDEANDREIDPYLVATIYAGLGDINLTIEYLTRAYEIRSHRLFTMLKVCPLLDRIRSDPRYLNLLEKLGLEQ